MKTVVSRGNSIRLIITHLCNETCRFCHNEGTDKDCQTEALIDVDIASNFVEEARSRFGVNTVHLTGGEPTLHPNLQKLIQDLKSKNFTVKLTTNGDCSESILHSVYGAGLDSINFSLHAITSEDFYFVQGERRPHEWCDRMMERKFNNIKLSMQLGLKTRINTVFINKEITARVLAYALENKIPLRLMRDLNNVAESEQRIQEIFKEKLLIPIVEETAEGDSGGSGTKYGYQNVMEKEQPDVKVKRFGDIYLKTLCGDCPLRGTERCRERFYGIRFEKNVNTQEHQIRLCIDQNNENTVIPLENFWKTAHIENIVQNYKYID